MSEALQRALLELSRWAGYAVAYLPWIVGVILLIAFLAELNGVRKSKGEITTATRKSLMTLGIAMLVAALAGTLLSRLFGSWGLIVQQSLDMIIMGQ